MSPLASLKSVVKKILGVTPAKSEQEPLESGYDVRVREEIGRFTDELQINNLPEIFHYWSHNYLRPPLESFGFSHPEAFFVREIEQQCAKSDGVVEVLSLGSGNCDIEISVAQSLVKNGCEKFTIRCLDITKAMLERGATLAKEQGLADHFSFEEADLNAWVPNRTYPVVLANQCLHHVQELEHLFRSVQEAIGNQGIFVTSDMIGRNGHQRWPEALVILKEFWAELPLEYRFNLQLKRQETEFLDWDCSTSGFEGIRSQDILPLAMQHFGFTFFYAFANVITPFIDRNFGHHLSPEREWDRNFIDRIQARDEQEILAGNIKPTHLMAVMVNDRSVTPVVWRQLTPEFCVRPT